MLRFHIFVYIFLVINSNNISKTVSDICECVPLSNCNSTDSDSENLISQAQHVGRTNMLGFPIKCGQRQEDFFSGYDLRDRILHSEKVANFAEFPWMLAILRRKVYQCGASLIHPKVALTAAHCVQKSGVYTIRAGDWDLSSVKEPLRHQDRLSQKIIIHPHYNSNSLANDIALIIVDHSFRFVDNVGVVCLPSPNSAPAPDECIVTGWGKTSHRSTRMERILIKATFPTVDNPNCEAALQRATLGPTFTLHDSFVCAGGGDKDTCKGDGGSPLVCGIGEAADAYEQFGIVSWGLVCGVYDTPGVYVGVARFVEWIDLQMEENGFSSEIYKYK